MSQQQTVQKQEAGFVLKGSVQSWKTIFEIRIQFNLHNAHRFRRLLNWNKYLFYKKSYLTSLDAKAARPVGYSTRILPISCLVYSFKLSLIFNGSKFEICETQTSVVRWYQVIGNEVVCKQNVDSNFGPVTFNKVAFKFKVGLERHGFQPHVTGLELKTLEL